MTLIQSGKVQQYWNSHHFPMWGWPDVWPHLHVFFYISSIFLLSSVFFHCISNIDFVKTLTSRQIQLKNYLLPLMKKIYGTNCQYYTLYSLSAFSLAKSLQILLEISATYKLGSYLLADNWLTCMYQFRFLAMVCLLSFSSKQCMIKQLLDSVFVIS